MWAPARYSTDLAGEGRWCILEAPLGHPCALLFTDDRERLGFLQADDDDQAMTFCQTLGSALRGAAAVGATTSDVFDYRAGRASQAVAARPVRTGPLQSLTRLTRGVPGPERCTEG